MYLTLEGLLEHCFDFMPHKKFCEKIDEEVEHGLRTKTPKKLENKLEQDVEKSGFLPQNHQQSSRNSTSKVWLQKASERAMSELLYSKQEIIKQEKRPKQTMLQLYKVKGKKAALI